MGHARLRVCGGPRSRGVLVGAPRHCTGLNNLIGYDGSEHVLVAAAIAHAESPKWTSQATLDTATDVLHAVAGLDQSLLDPRPAFWPAFSKHRTSDDAQQLDSGIAAELLDHYRTLQTTPRTVPAHLDPRPDNWLASPRGLHLIEFDHVNTAPPGWDLAYLTTTLPLPAARRAAWLQEVVSDGDLNQLVGAFTYRLACGAHAATATKAYRTYAAAACSSSLELYRALQN